MRIARRECLNDQKRSFSGCGRQPGAERREEADKPHTTKHAANNSVPLKKQSAGILILHKINMPEVQGTLPCREIFKRQAAS